MALLTYKGAVLPWHCDEMGHMNVMWYVGKFDEATRHLFSAVGLTPAFLRDNNRGMAAVEQHITYKRELLAGDIIEIHSEVLEIKDKSLRFAHEMRKTDTGELSATTVLTGLHLDKIARRACAFPAAIREQVAAMRQAAAKDAAAPAR
jgi:acyl-CoA thioester hydrolase